jgi:predicted DCC family thiol-disulfide oxidoreductase YuxK|tara:strand:- start:93 stop:437 length:345 start_codon:yes stop_codon:yes gene_type:complete
MPSRKSAIVLFDDQCNKCNRWAEFIRRRDAGNRISLIGQNSPDGLELMKTIPKSLEDLDSIFLVSEVGMWHYKSAAIWRVCRELRFPWPLATGMVLIPWPIRDYFYDLYARLRK